MILVVSVELELRTRLRAEEKREQAPALQMKLSTELIVAEDNGEPRKALPSCLTSLRMSPFASTKMRPFLARLETSSLGMGGAWRWGRVPPTQAGGRGGLRGGELFAGEGGEGAGVGAVGGAVAEGIVPEN